MQDHRFLGVKDINTHARPGLSELFQVTNLPILKLRQDLVDAVHVQAEQILDPVIGVYATFATAHLHEPGPDSRWGSTDSDCPRRKNLRTRKKLITRQNSAYVLVGCAPGETRLAPD